jgi:hypothetical protein
MKRPKVKKKKLAAKEKQKAEKESLAERKGVSPYLLKAPRKGSIYSLYCGAFENNYCLQLLRNGKRII